MALPNTYNRLDYVESSGTQYFNLSTLDPNALGRVECAFTFASSVSTYAACLLGSSSDYNSARIIRRYNGANSGWNFQVSNVSASGTSATNVLTPNTRYEFDVDFNNGYGKVNDTIIYNFTGYPSSSSSFRNLYLLADNDSDGVSWRARGKLEYFKAYDRSGNIIMNLIPAIRKNDSVVGMYDDINDVFYTNAGSGNFTYGNILYNVSAEANPSDSGEILGTGYYEGGSQATLTAIANAGFEFNSWELNDYTKLDYIESSGTQYIDTGIGGAQASDIKVVSNIMWTGSLSDNFILGTKLSTNGRRFPISALNGKWNFGLGGSNYQSDNITLNQKYNVEAQFLSGNSYLKVDGATKTTNTSSLSSSANYNFVMFAYNNTGSVSNYTSGRIYDMQMFVASTGVMIRNYIPVKRNSDSAIGLLDLVEMKFYANKGSGTFTYGQELGTITFNNNPLSFIANDDVDFIANFDVSYQITLVYDSNLGNASYSWVGSQIQLIATPNNNSQFKGWYINSIPISTNSTYTYTVLSDVTIEARFEEIYAINDSVIGNGAIQYTRGIDRNDVVFSVIADTNNHFIKYEVDGVEYTTTPLSLHLTQAINIVAYFEEDDRYHITVNSDFPYGSFYISENDVFSGTVVTIWARPFPDYNFVKWQDGELANPRQITVTENVTLVAEYQRTFETNGIYQYRCYIKDQLDLEALPKAFMVVDTFEISTDLLTNATSSIKVMDVFSDVDEGDVLVLYDPMGTTLYTGVINSIEDKTINCSQMQSFYKGTWIYNVNPQSTLEEEIALLLQDYADGKLYRSNYVDPLVAQRLGGITIDFDGTTTVNLPTDLDEDGNEQMTTYDMEEFIYELYQKYSIKFDFEINVSGTNYVHIRVPSFETIKVGNNMYAIQNMSPITEIEETNKLVVFAQDKTYRTTYIATKNEIVEQPATTANRFNITNTEVVFSDDPIEDLIASNLPSQMFNHKVTFTLIIRNFIYEFGDFNLGGELDIYKDDDYFNSVLTGYNISKQSNQNIVQVDFVCGKVRTALTKMLTLGKV